MNEMQPQDVKESISRAADKAHMSHIPIAIPWKLEEEYMIYAMLLYEIHLPLFEPT